MLNWAFEVTPLPPNKKQAKKTPNQNPYSMQIYSSDDDVLLKSF